MADSALPLPSGYFQGVRADLQSFVQAIQAMTNENYKMVKDLTVLLKQADEAVAEIRAYLPIYWVVAAALSAISHVLGGPILACSLVLAFLSTVTLAAPAWGSYRRLKIINLQIQEIQRFLSLIGPIIRKEMEEWNSRVEAGPQLSVRGDPPSEEESLLDQPISVAQRGESAEDTNQPLTTLKRHEVDICRYWLAKGRTLVHEIEEARWFRANNIWSLGAILVINAIFVGVLPVIVMILDRVAKPTPSPMQMPTPSPAPNFP